jgi:Domain of unknown function (DUF4956)
MNWLQNNLWWNMGIDALSLILIVIMLHYRLYKKSEYIFTYIIFNIIIFLLSYVLKTGNISIGAAFGLFAVFSMIRYRTEDISARDMTYLFIVMALGMLNAMETDGVKLLFYNGLVIGIAYLLESNVLMQRESIQSIQYENIQNIKPENRAVLIADLSERTGLKINRVEIGKIDFLRDTAVVKIYYND